MSSPTRITLTAVFLLAAVVLVLIAARRTGLRGHSASWRERVFISTPLMLCVFACGVSLFGGW